MEPKFEQSIIEKDLEQISQKVIEHKGKITPGQLTDKEAVRSALSEKVKPTEPAEPTAASQPKERNLPQYLNDSPPDIQSKVKELVDMAFEKGIDKSIAEAKKQSPFILDALHDALTTKVYEELKQRGKLK